MSAIFLLLLALAFALAWLWTGELLLLAVGFLLVAAGVRSFVRLCLADSAACEARSQAQLETYLRAIRGDQ